MGRMMARGVRWIGPPILCKAESKEAMKKFKYLNIPKTPRLATNAKASRALLFFGFSCAFRRNPTKYPTRMIKDNRPRKRQSHHP